MNNWNNPKYLKAVESAKQFRQNYPELCVPTEIYLIPDSKFTYSEIDNNGKHRILYRGGWVNVTIGNVCMLDIWNGYDQANTHDWWVFLPKDMKNEN